MREFGKTRANLNVCTVEGSTTWWNFPPQVPPRTSFYHLTPGPCKEYVYVLPVRLGLGLGLGLRLG